jgi:hypothetical protein
VRRTGPAFALALGLALAVGVSAADATTNAFIGFSAGPRAAALGGHLVALVLDDDAVNTNPARLAYVERGMSARYDRLQPDVDLWHGRVGFAMPLGALISEPLQTSRLHHTGAGVSLDVTSLTLIEGSGYGEASFAGGFAYAPASQGAIGVTARYERAQSDVDAIAAHAYGVDIGVSVDLSDHWDAALSIKNAFGRAQFDGADDEDRAAQLTLGVATARRKRWQAELDYVFQYDKNAAFAGGFEYHVVPGVLDLRAGVAREVAGVTRMIPSAGLGVLFSRFRFDYAFRDDPDGGQSAQHRVAVGARF